MASLSFVIKINLIGYFLFYFQLHIASANGYIDVLEFLLDHHVSLHIRDYDSWLPIHAAACWLQVMWKIFNFVLVKERVKINVLLHNILFSL